MFEFRLKKSIHHHNTTLTISSMFKFIPRPLFHPSQNRRYLVNIIRFEIYAYLPGFYPLLSNLQCTFFFLLKNKITWAPFLMWHRRKWKTVWKTFERSFFNWMRGKRRDMIKIKYLLVHFSCKMRRTWR